MRSGRQEESGRAKRKTAVALPGNTTAFQTTQHAYGTPEQREVASNAMRRLLLSRLNQLGLVHSSVDSESIFIGGQAYDLRTATAMARLLGAGS